MQSEAIWIKSNCIEEIKICFLKECELTWLTLGIYYSI